MTTMSKNTQPELALDFEMELARGDMKGAMKAAGATSGDLWSVPREDIRVLPNFNVRVKNEKYYARVRNIANSMKQEGFKKDKPLSGFVAKDPETGKDVIFMYGGHRRLEAVDLANSEGSEIKNLPMVIAPRGTTIEDLTADLVTGNNGDALEPFEAAIVAKRLLGFGWEIPAIATRLDFTTTYINDLLMLMESPKALRDMVQRDEVSASTAIELLHKHGAKAAEILQNGLVRAQAAGKTRVTGKFVPGAVYKKAVQKSAPVLVSTLKDLREDPGYQNLSPEFQSKLADLLAHLDAAEKADAQQGLEAPAPSKDEE